MEYNVSYIRSQGIECKWGRTSNGAPIIVGKTDRKNGKGEHIWAWIDNEMWRDARVMGLREAFDAHTALIDYFSVSA